MGERPAARPAARLITPAGAASSPRRAAIGAAVPVRAYAGDRRWLAHSLPAQARVLRDTARPAAGRSAISGAGAERYELEVSPELYTSLPGWTQHDDRLGHGDTPGLGCLRRLMSAGRPSGIRRTGRVPTSQRLVLPRSGHRHWFECDRWPASRRWRGWFARAAGSRSAATRPPCRTARSALELAVARAGRNLERPNIAHRVRRRRDSARSRAADRNPRRRASSPTSW